MKRLIFLLIILCTATVNFYAQTEGDDYDDAYVYLQNGPGDQFLKLDLSACFPLNFSNKVYVGVGADFGYYRFITPMIALGGEISISDNITIGNKALFIIPITVGAMFQPTINKFEIPITLTAGIASHTLQTETYFPALAVKATTGLYYRFFEGWSFGITGSFLWSPEWFSSSQTMLPKAHEHNGLFIYATLGARYHF